MKRFSHLRHCVVVGLASVVWLSSPDIAGVPLLADPVLSVTDSGTANGNQLWLVEVAPDPDLFSDTPEGFGGSLAVELDFLISDSEVVSVIKNAADWPSDNSGFNPFISGISQGVTFDTTTAFISLGSNVFTTADPVEVVTIETLGAGLGTLSWGGQVAAPVGTAEYETARIAQGGMKFDGYQGTISADTQLAGDYSGNGLVEQADLDLVLSNWGSSTPPAPAGWIGVPPVGLIDQAELDGVLTNWGASTVGAAALPEPSTTILLLLCCGLVPLWMRLS